MPGKQGSPVTSQQHSPPAFPQGQLTCVGLQGKAGKQQQEGSEAEDSRGTPCPWGAARGPLDTGISEAGADPVPCRAGSHCASLGGCSFALLGTCRIRLK